eukprot:TRINITY_DN11107_c0_g1_i1.p1 TRINITY_DN11107_c0_g1~~TRINITY_DN11107_c0_g1_i1.p1  ORF type:complete len:314 (+),score=45.27 TRINITY_DN11107_c0_g1_i1:93-944(+)
MSDSGHWGPGIPLLLYSAYKMWHATSSHASPRAKLRERRDLLIESVMLILVGGGLFSLVGNTLYFCTKGACVDENVVHVLLGLLTMQVGVCSLFFLSYHPILQQNAFNFIRGFIFCVVGLFISMHEQSNDMLTSIHKWMGLCIFLTGVLAPFASHEPRLRLFFAFFMMVSSLLILFGSPSAFQFFRHTMTMKSMGVVMVAFNLSLFSIVLTFVLRVLEGGAAHHSSGSNGEGNVPSRPACSAGSQGLMLFLATPLFEISDAFLDTSLSRNPRHVPSNANADLS